MKSKGAHTDEVGVEEEDILARLRGGRGRDGGAVGLGPGLRHGRVLRSGCRGKAGLRWTGELGPTRVKLFRSRRLLHEGRWLLGGVSRGGGMMSERMLRSAGAGRFAAGAGWAGWRAWDGIGCRRSDGAGWDRRSGREERKRCRQEVEPVERFMIDKRRRLRGAAWPHVASAAKCG
jgi:hypothetical protein